MRILILTLFLFTLPVIAQVSGSVSLVSDYVCRGVSQGNGDPSLQANLAYTTSGFTFNFEYASLSRERKDNEFVANVGYTFEVGDNFTITPTYRYHYYQSPLETFDEFDYEEFNVTLDYRNAVLDLWVDENEAFYYEGAYTFIWSSQWSTLIAAGYVDTDDLGYHIVNPEKNYRIELTRSFSNLDTTFAYSDTDNRQELTGQRFILGITYSF